MTDDTAQEQPAGEPYAATCERCPWSMTGERPTVIRAAIAHVCEPPADDEQPAGGTPAPPADWDAANG